MCEQKGEKADQNDEREKAGGDTPQDVVAEYKGQNDPKKAIPEEVEPQGDSRDFQPRPPTRPHAKWKVGGFRFPVIFLYAFHNLRLFFYAVAEPVWMVSGFRSFKKKGLAHARFLRKIRSPFRERGRFFAKPPRRPDLAGAGSP